MKIESSNRTNTVTAPTTPVARGAKQAPQAGAAQDNVQLSSMSAQLQALETSINEASGFDAGKVEGIKQAIDDGNYTVNAETIANKLISSTQELLAQQKG
jgi:negative regulator of flagellin synthesis FlgM